MKNIDIFIKDIKFEENLLDIGFSNYGVMYSLYKESKDKIQLDYYPKGFKGLKGDVNKYDCCTLFFCLNGCFLKRTKIRLIKRINSLLMDGSNIYIWDYNKGYFKIFNNNIIVNLPKGEKNEIRVKDYNIFKNSSLKSIEKTIKEYFDIVEKEESNGVYYCKCIKKNRGNK